MRKLPILFLATSSPMHEAIAWSEGTIYDRGKGKHMQADS
jgi:hypothetical protein